MPICNIKNNLDYWNNIDFQPIIDSSLLVQLVSDPGLSTWTNRISNEITGATLAGTATRTQLLPSGIFGNGLSIYNSASNYANLGTSNLLNVDASTDFTIQMGIIFASTPSAQTGFYGTNLEWDSGQGFKFYYHYTSATLRVMYNYGGAFLYKAATSSSISGGITPNIYHDVCIVKSGTVFYFYYDGNPLGSYSSADIGTMNRTGGSKRIGRAWADTFNGDVIYFLNYNKALTSAEINHNFTRSICNYLNNNI